MILGGRTLGEDVLSFPTRGSTYLFTTPRKTTYPAQASEMAKPGSYGTSYYKADAHPLPHGSEIWIRT